MTPDPDHRLDYARQERIRIGEAVYCEGKTAEQIRAIVAEAQSLCHSMLLTRLSPEKHATAAADLAEPLDYDPLSRTAISGELAPLRRPAGAVPVHLVLGGTSDLPVATEAERTLRFHGVAAQRLADVGVAGLHRLMDHIERLRDAPVILVFAGMDAALPSVVGGLVRGAVIAVPTSAGYGVAAGGIAALNSALASCAPGVTVTNIDNGFGAACAALRILHAAERLEGSSPS